MALSLLSKHETRARNGDAILGIEVVGRLIGRKSAAAYLGISVNHFARHIEPHLDAVPGIGRRVLFDRIDLDNLIDTLKRADKAGGWFDQCNLE